MSAWSKDLTKAPKDKQILFRHPETNCPIVVYWGEYDDWKGWLFADDLISDVVGSVEEEILPDIEWAELPL